MDVRLSISTGELEEISGGLLIEVKQTADEDEQKFLYGAYHAIECLRHTDYKDKPEYIIRRIQGAFDLRYGDLA